MPLPSSLLVVLACTLAGGLERKEILVGNQTTCAKGTAWMECGVLDETIPEQDLSLPFLVTLGTIMFLSMPTLLLRSKHKERGLSLIAWNLFRCLGLKLCSSFTTDHPSICFALSLHSCALMLSSLETSRALVGPAWWWGLRYVALFGLLVWEVCLGPAISVVRWPSTPGGTALPCAYLAHLAGSILPGSVLYVLGSLLVAVKCMWFDD